MHTLDWACARMCNADRHHASLDGPAAAMAAAQRSSGPGLAVHGVQAQTQKGRECVGCGAGGGWGAALLPADWCDPKAPGGLENQCSVLTPCHYVSACSSTDIYSNTVNLPKTSFDMRANSTVREPQLQAFWQEHRVYETLSRENPGVGCRGVCGGSCVTGWCAGRLGL